MRARIESLGSTLTALSYVPADPQAVAADLGPLVRGRDRVDLMLIVNGVSTDPGDACFVAIEALGGRVARRGVPANPGSMTWLARIGATDLLGYASGGAARSHRPAHRDGRTVCPGGRGDERERDDEDTRAGHDPPGWMAGRGEACLD